MKLRLSNNRLRTSTLLIIIFFFTLISPLFGKSNQTILSYVKKQQNKGALWRAGWAVYAEYTDNGQTIVNWNGSKNLIPASGMKLFTTAAALNILGKDFRFYTKMGRKSTWSDFDNCRNTNVGLCQNKIPCI